MGPHFKQRSTTKIFESLLEYNEKLITMIDSCYPSAMVDSFLIERYNSNDSYDTFDVGCSPRYIFIYPQRFSHMGCGMRSELWRPFWGGLVIGRVCGGLVGS